jgi:hypothetical protein
MILLIFGIYALAAARLQISRNYGLKGKGARIAGCVCISFALGFFSLFSSPLVALSKAFGFEDIGATVLGFVFQLVSLFLVLFVLVRIYGNGFPKAQRTIEEAVQESTVAQPSYGVLAWTGLVALGVLGGFFAAKVSTIHIVCSFLSIIVCIGAFVFSRRQPRRTSFLLRCLGYIAFGFGTIMFNSVGMIVDVTVKNPGKGFFPPILLIAIPVGVIVGAYYLVFRPTAN